MKEFWINNSIHEITILACTFATMAAYVTSALHGLVLFQDTRGSASLKFILNIQLTEKYIHTCTLVT